MRLKWILSLSMCVVIFSANAQKKSADTTVSNIIITPENPLPVKDSFTRQAIVKWSEAQLESKDYKKIKAHPSSDIFPGKVKDGYEFVNKTITISHKKIADSLLPIVSRLNYSGQWDNTLYSTGLYAVAGQFIEVIIPKHLQNKGLKVQIGCHSDRLNDWVAATEAWRRMPIIVKEQELVKEKTRVASPFGGIIYISASPRAEDWTEEITINHGITSLLFKLGTTTQQEWEEQLKNNKAPWGELASNDIIITIPDSVLQQVKDPEKVMKLWDLIISGEMDLAQIPQPFYRAQRLVVDEHLGGGFMHSGYPIMVHHSPVEKMLSEDVIANPELLMRPNKGGANWGFFHEIGHNLQNLDWVFDGTSEVSCNFFTMYMFDRLMGGRDNAHTDISNTFTQSAMKKYFEEGAKFEKWEDDPFLGLIMFRQLQENFGWEAFKKLFREYHSMAAKDPAGRYADTEQKKRDLWVKTFSTITQKNISSFFEKWGISISAEVKEELSKYPAWLPFNFPSVN